VTVTPTHRMITPSILYFGNPVVIVSSLNADGSTNLAPISSAWALGDLFVLGLGSNGHTLQNIRRRPELVLNFPWAHQWAQVEALALLTGADPVPEGKPAYCRYEPDKFRAAGWSPLASDLVDPQRVRECGAHIETEVIAVHSDTAREIVVVHARAVRVHADAGIVVPGTSHIDPASRQPLLYNFRHYFGLGARLGIARRAERQS
jgi:flavin reductase (DIM6/NTAB) family NADH-FMN oxidoreductase RutF